MQKLKNFLKFKGSKKTKIISVIVLVAAMAGGGYLLTYAQQFIDSFLDTTRVANQWNVEVDTVNGEVKLATRTCDDAVWFCDLASVCANTAGDGENILVKRTNEVQSIWKTGGGDCNKPWCGLDGAQSGDFLVSDNTIDFSSFPARQACKVGGGRLPTLTELQCIYTNRAQFGNNFLSSNYWSSIEVDATAAKSVSFSTGSVSNYSKASGCYARCVKGW